MAARMEALGLGLRLKDETAIRTAVETVLQDPKYRENTRRLAAEFHACGGAKAAADKIESCAG